MNNDTFVLLCFKNIQPDEISQNSAGYMCQGRLFEKFEVLQNRVDTNAF